LAERKGLEIGPVNSAHFEDSRGEANLPNRPEDDPLFRYLHAELRERLTDAINILAEQERQVLTLYYYEDLKQREIGLILSVGESRISQILTSAHLRTHLRAFTHL
jgi:RNA polymerase sigma factor FliA